MEFDIPSLPTEMPRYPRYIFSIFYMITNLLFLSIIFYPFQFVGTLSRQLYLRYTTVFKHTFTYLLVLFTQIFSPSEIIITGHDVRCCPPESAILMPNHQLYSDWLYCWALAYLCKAGNFIRLTSKESVQYIPLVGWGGRVMEFIFLKRQWALDKIILETYLKQYSEDKIPVWLMLFPEGTNVCDITRKKSHAFSEKMNYVKLSKVLMPKSTGIQFCLETMRAPTFSHRLTSIYDITMGFSGVPKGKDAYDIYSFPKQFLFGETAKYVHMHIRRIPVMDIPHNEQEFGNWLRYRFWVKEKLMEYFEHHDEFPTDPGWEIKECIHKNPMGWSIEVQEAVRKANIEMEGNNNAMDQIQWLNSPAHVPIKVRSGLLSLPLVFIPPGVVWFLFLVLQQLYKLVFALF